jgi:putative transposase
MESSEQAVPRRMPQKGHRYSPAEKEQILAEAQAQGVTQASKAHGCADWTIRRWLKVAKKEEDKANLFPVGAEKTSAAPGRLEPKERDEAVLAMWKKHPALGPSQIVNQLRREKSLHMSVNTVRAVMEEHGYVLPKVRRKEHQGEYEAVRPRQMYHLDFFHFLIHKLAQCLLFLVDDFSRFIAGWALVSSEQVDVVIRTFEGSVARYGNVENAMSDGGSAFHSWRGIGRFTRFLEEYGINPWIAKDPSVNGKVESLNSSFQRELVQRVEFADRDDAQRQIAAWVRHYNFQRTHQALGGLLVPADRFLGCVEDSMRRIEEGHGGSPLDLLAPESRALELFRVVSEGGSPKVYLMGRKILG